MKAKNVRFTTLIATAVAMMSTSPIQAATGQQTTIDQRVLPGSLELTATPSASFGDTVVNILQDYVGQTQLGRIDVTDSRGSDAGWSVTATTSDITRIGSPQDIKGNGHAITAFGHYSGTQDGAYTVTVTGINDSSIQLLVGSNGLDPNASSVTTVTAPGDVAIGTKGLMLSFADFTQYSLGDKWSIPVSVLATHGITLTPQTIAAISGDIAGVNPGVPHSFSGTSDSATLMVADAGHGAGGYDCNPLISLTIPKESLKIGTFSAVITETIN